MLALALLAAVLIIGLAAGFYPAMVMSAFRPINTLKTGIVRSVGSFKVRQLTVAAHVLLVARWRPAAALRYE